jgi:hypothetical protein
MIAFDFTSREKLELLDRFLLSISTEDLLEIIGSELVSAKLKGGPPARGPIQEMLDNMTCLEVEVSTLRSELSILRTDIGTLVESAYKPYDMSTANNMSNLKSRYGVY